MLPSLQRSGSRRIPATSADADGYFRYIAESVVNADFREAKRSRQNAKKVLYSSFNRNIISVKTALSALFCIM